MYRADLYETADTPFACLYTDDEAVLLVIERELLGAGIPATDHDAPDRSVRRIRVQDPHGVHVTDLYAADRATTATLVTPGSEHIDQWDTRSAMRTAIELYDAYGDPDDILSSSQVEALGRLRPDIVED
ncbi:hypothetical protein ACFXKF_32895 [Streptomyces scopuliridis]|uniref:hypothetical protein n=1 Tax=Streptomyces scopuliridis TaxID=452529 RepID=UPI0036BDED33